MIRTPHYPDEQQVSDMAIVLCTNIVKALFSFVAHYPSPNTYPTKSAFSKETKKFSYTFGLSREHFQKVYLAHNPPRDLTVPGPGTYQEKKVVGNNGEKYTMRVKPSKSFTVMLRF
jgi:hypothetical protein